MDANTWLSDLERDNRIESATDMVRRVCRRYREDMMRGGLRANPANAAHHLGGAATLAELQGNATMAEAFRQAAMYVAQHPDAGAALRAVSEAS